jgi:hypothetical protein
MLKGLSLLAYHPLVNDRFEEINFLLSEFFLAFSQPIDFIELFPKLEFGS